MVTIDGLTMAGLGPPGIAPGIASGVAHGTTRHASFASLLAAAEQQPAGGAAVPLLIQNPASPVLPLTPQAAGDASADAALRGGTSHLGPPGDLIGAPALEAGARAHRPDRTSEAASTGTGEDVEEPSLLATSLAAQGTVVKPPLPWADTPAASVTASGNTPAPIVGASAPAPLEEAAGAESSARDDAGRPVGPDRVLVGVAPGERGEVASAAARARHLEGTAPANVGNAGETGGAADRGGQPEERLGPLIRDLPVDERSAVARAWTRAGGRYQVDDVPPTDLAPPVDSVPVAETAGAGGAEMSVEMTLEGAAAGEQDPAGGQGDEPFVVTTDAALGITDPSGLPTGQIVATAETRGIPIGEATLDASTPVDTSDPAVVRARLTDSVYAAARNGDESIRLVLSPPELGHLDIRVERSDGGLRVDVTAATAEAADLIQQALPALVSGLEARSLRVDHAEVRQASAGSGMADARGSDEGARQSRERGADGQPEWARPDWSDAARLGGNALRAARGRASEQLLDLVA